MDVLNSIEGDKMSNDIVYNYPKEKRFTLAILQDIQKEYGYIPREYMESTSHYLNIPLTDVYSLATFYKALSLKPNRWSSLTRELRDSDKLYNHIITKTKETALRRFAAIKVGENFHSLDTSMKEDTYTDVTRTQKTIYLRLDYDQPSGTVVNVRKSMWIHPEYNRAVSIREAARLQTFPDSFIFMGNKDSQYQQVGNAVPPILAKAIATELARLLDNEPAGKKENSNTINI